MFKRAITRTAVAACALAAIGAAPAGASQGEAGYLVQFKGNIKNSEAKTNAMEPRVGFKATHVYDSVIEGFAAKLTTSEVGKLRKDPNVAAVVRDALAFEGDGTIATERAGETTPTGLQRVAMDGLLPTVTDGSVAVLDSGIDLQHTDLNAVNGTNCVDPTKTADDDNGHGTHVAGTVAARNNGSGVHGVVPDTRVVAVKVLNSQGDGTWSQIICGLDWVRANAARLGIRVANMSLSNKVPATSDVDDRQCGATRSDGFGMLHAAVCRVTNAGISIVASAGNAGADFKGVAPAAFNEVITVTAMADTDGRPGGSGPRKFCGTGTQTDDTPATFSNYATNAIDSWHTVAAPGACILSTRNGGGVTEMSGTSMASPLVAGFVAYCTEAFPGWMGRRCPTTPEGIRYDLWNYSATRPASYGYTGDPDSNQPAGRQYLWLIASP